MHKWTMIAAPLLALASPAAATGGYVCITKGAKPIELSIVTGYGVAPVVAQVRLVQDGRSWSSAGAKPQLLVAQSWIDSRESASTSSIRRCSVTRRNSGRAR